MEVGFRAHERRRFGGEAEQVVEDEDLTVATSAGADADGRDANGGSDGRHEGLVHALDDQREGAGLGDGDGIGE